MELVRGNDCVVDTSDNTRMWYLINGACVLEGREPKKASITNGVSDRGGGPIPLARVSAMGTEGKLTVYNHQGGGSTDAYTPRLTLWE